MKKILACLLAVAALGGATGCKKQTDFGKYESVAGKALDANFSFETSFKEYDGEYPQSDGRTFYVAADGSSENDGLSETSPVDIAAANSKEFQSALQAGDSVLFRRGDTFGQLSFEGVRGKAGNPVTLGAYGEGEKPFFRYEGNVVMLKYCDNIVLRDFAVEVVGVERSPLNPSQRAGISLIYDHTNEKFRNVYIFDNEIYSQGVDKNTFGIEVSAAAKNYASAPDEVLVNLHIKRNEVHDVGRSGIHTIGWLVDEGYNNVKWTLYKDIFIDENVVYNVGCMGIYITCCTNSTINRNLVYNAGMYDKPELMEGECGIMALCADKMDIMYNVIYGCRDQALNFDAMGIDIDWNTRNVNVQYNYCYENMGSGIGTMANQSCFIKNNRLENNYAATGGHSGQISVTAFTSRVYGVPENYHNVSSLTISENLLIGTPKDKNMFYTTLSNGDADWKNNVFTENRVVYTGDDLSSMRFVCIDGGTVWQSFSDNRYYSQKTTVFRCYDNTPQSELTGDAQAYGGQSMQFEKWQKRDTGSTYELLSDDAPSAPQEPSATFEGGEIALRWKESKGDLWHYNVYLVEEGEDVSYLNMLGETEVCAYTFTAEHKGEYYFVVQPESNQGVYGKALKIKVELR